MGQPVLAALLDIGPPDLVALVSPHDHGVAVVRLDRPAFDLVVRAPYPRLGLAQADEIGAEAVGECLDGVGIGRPVGLVGVIALTRSAGAETGTSCANVRGCREALTPLVAYVLGPPDH